MEANPSSITAARARVWKAAGVNRISIGVQSLEADALRFLGRVHDADRALAAVAEVRAAGFTSINCDLIYAVPGLGDTRWRRTLERVVAAGPTHVSCYELTVEPGTPLHTRVRRGLVTPVDGARSMRQHRIAVDVLERRRVRAVRGQQLRASPARSAATTSCTGTTGTTPRPASAPTATCRRPPPQRSASTSRPARCRCATGTGAGSPPTGALSGPASLPVTGSEPVGPGMREQERVMLGLRLREGVRIGRRRASTRRVRSRASGSLAVDGRSGARDRRAARPCSTRSPSGWWATRRPSWYA